MGRALANPASVLAIAVASSLAPGARAQPGSAAETAPTAPTLAPHQAVLGTDLTSVELADASRASWRPLAWGELARTKLAPGTWVVRFPVAGGDHIGLEVPVCAGRTRLLVDGVVQPLHDGPVVVPLLPRPEEAHDVEIEIAVSGYEHRIACAHPPRFGAVTTTTDGLGLLTFASPHVSAGGGKAVVYLPPHHDPRRPAALLVGAHPWNGSIWTYAAYTELLREAAARDVVLLMPSGLGNSLYVAAAEDEVLRALDAVEQVVAVDPHRVSIWGASMGGAGATTIGFHHPDRFASVTSFFGDSKYDISTYVHALLPTEGAAHLVNALDVVDNARNVPVWLVHGEDDRVSPIAQSAMLASAMQAKGFSVRFDRVSHAGHDGVLVARFAADVVDRASEARVPAAPTRVTYRSVRLSDTGAYGVHLVRAPGYMGDAFVDLERHADGTVHVREAVGVRAIDVERGALGSRPDAPASALVVDGQSAVALGARAPSKPGVEAPSSAVEVRWLAPPADTRVR